MPAIKRPGSRQVAAACVAAAVMCLPLTKVSEGRRLAPYRDPANIVTWCYGETQGKPKDRYTEGECEALLENHLARVYAPRIAACTPQLADERHIAVFAALLDASFNAGAGAVCASPMAAAARRNDMAGACEALIAVYTVEGMHIRGWFASARYTGKPHPAAAMRRAGWTWTGKNWRKELRGLVTRRIHEARLCLGGTQ